MNRFKSNYNQTKQEDYQRRKDQVQLLGILDKQILRDDRIWLRNKIKQTDQDVVLIFRKYLSKRPFDLSSLQVSLRKYVMKIKDKCKKDQLQKFKENLNSTSANTLFERQNMLYQRSSKSTEIRKPQNNRIKYQEQEYCLQDNFRNYSKGKNQTNQQEYRNVQERRDKSSNRHQQYERLKITDPICEQEQIEQVFSYRSKSELNRPKSSQRSSNQISNHNQTSTANNWSRQRNTFVRKQQESRRERQKQLQKQTQKQLQLDIQENEVVEIYPHFNTGNYRRQIQPQTSYLSRQKNIPFTQQIYRIQESQVESNILKNQITSHANSNLDNSETDFVNENSDTFAHQFKIELNSPSLQPPSFSGTPVASSLSEDKSKFNQFNNYNFNVVPCTQNYFPNTSSENISQKHLFTNPSLLEECKRFLEQSRSASISAEGSKQDISQSKKSDCNYEDTYTQRDQNQQANFGDRLADKARDCNSQTKMLPSVTNPIYQQKYSANPLPYLGIAESFEREDNQQINGLIPDISQLYAEDVFDIIFSSTIPSISINYKNYEKKVNQNFMEKQKLIKLFKLGDKTMSNTLLATDFGRLLLTNCNYKPSPNPVKQIFSLIDIDRKGFFTLDDYQRFLQQVIDSQDPDSNHIIDICEGLFQNADISKSQRVEYWGLYLTKNSNEFKQFSTFLQQFEFEFEVV